MARQRVDRTYDHDLRLKAAGAVTASGAGTLIIDIGGRPTDARGATRGKVSRTDGCVVVNVSAIDSDDGNETYEVWSQYSNSATFASGVVWGQGLRPTAVGQFEVGTTNEINGTAYRYMRLHTTVGGTSPSVNYTAALYL